MSSKRLSPSVPINGFDRRCSTVFYPVREYSVPKLSRDPFSTCNYTVSEKRCIRCLLSSATLRQESSRHNGVTQGEMHLFKTQSLPALCCSGDLTCALCAARRSRQSTQRTSSSQGVGEWMDSLFIKRRCVWQASPLGLGLNGRRR